MVRERVRPIARSYFDERVSPAHDWHHVERVEALAERLAAEYPGVDRTVLEIAVLCHDVGRAREDAGEVDDHAAWGARETRRILTERTAGHDRESAPTPAQVDAICHCVRAHRYSTGVEPETLEAKLLSDADNLDALGAIGVARVFAHGGDAGTPILDPDLPPAADDSRAGATGANHLAKKILDLPNRMYTEAGRELAAERAAFVERFADRLAAEAVGKR